MVLDFPGTASPFDGLRRVAADGSEYWSARDIMPLMGYRDRNAWQDFSRRIVGRAMTSTANQGEDVTRHFTQVSESTNGRNRQNYQLTRFAAYLVAMNGDPRKLRAWTGPAILRALAKMPGVAGRSRED